MSSYRGSHISLFAEDTKPWLSSASADVLLRPEAVSPRRTLLIPNTNLISDIAPKKSYLNRLCCISDVLVRDAGSGPGAYIVQKHLADIWHGGRRTAYIQSGYVTHQYGKLLASAFEDVTHSL